MDEVRVDSVESESNPDHQSVKEDSPSLKSTPTSIRKQSFPSLSRMSSSFGMTNRPPGDVPLSWNTSTTANDAAPRKKTSRTGMGILSGFAGKKDKYKCLTDGLKSCYKEVLKPMEGRCNFYDFHGPKMDEGADFDTKPIVLFIGQYSTGKTSFLKYLLQEDYPGINIGPEPTTDKFTIILHGPSTKVMQGNSVVLDSKLPFRSLSKYGNTFLNRLMCVSMDNPTLTGLTLVDTPGVLSGRKQTCERGYDFTAVLVWFAARVDRIILLFDAHKMDISDELQSCIRALRPYDEKLRILLNKCDSVSTDQLIRVYGALMWSLGRALQSPEVSKVFIGSFWDQPLQKRDLSPIFQQNMDALLQDLLSLPQMAALRKINDLSKRIRLLKIHALIINEVLKRAPNFLTLNKEKKKKEVIDNLGEVYHYIEFKFGESPGDFPSISMMQENLRKIDWCTLRKTDMKDIDKLDHLLDKGMCSLLDLAQNIDKCEPQTPSISLPKRFQRKSLPAHPSTPHPLATLDFLHAVRKRSNNLEYKSDGGQSMNLWPPEQHPKFWDWCEAFDNSEATDGRLCVEKGQPILLLNGKIKAKDVDKVWTLSDMDMDGMLNKDEFCLAMYLSDMMVNQKQPLPASLPEHLLLPTKA